jgi:hypothetical protein
MLGFLRQLVDVSGLATAATAATYRTSLSHYAVALENRKVCPKAVVGETQRPCELLDGVL